MRRVIWILFLCLFFVTFVAAPRSRPGCSCSPSPPQMDPGDAKPSSSSLNEARRDSPPLILPGAAPPKVKPLFLKDDKSGVIFYFESDGQHVAAIDKDGSVLWHKNPVEERGIKGFSNDGKTVWPTIFYAGPPLGWMVKAISNRGMKGEYIGISLNTKEFGLIDTQTGVYTTMGSNSRTKPGAESIGPSCRSRRL